MISYNKQCSSKFACPLELRILQQAYKQHHLHVYQTLAHYLEPAKYAISNEIEIPRYISSMTNLEIQLTK